MDNMPHEERWRDALTLGEWIVQMVRKKQTQAPEFVALLAVYGKAKVRALYETQLAKERADMTLAPTKGTV